RSLEHPVARHAAASRRNGTRTHLDTASAATNGADLDPCWPRVAGQLTGRHQRPDLGAVHACASLAVAQAMRLFSPAEPPPPAWNATLEIDAFDGRIRHRGWPPHPLCGCGAQPVQQET
ncbi:hypothetical protein ACWEN0_49480, partial [Amycolatopsis sp. NPDC004378]